MRTWLYVVGVACFLGSILVTLALTGPRPVDHGLIKVGMTKEEIERILPKQNWAELAVDNHGVTVRYFESGVVVCYLYTIINNRVMKTTAAEVEFVNPTPRSYLTRLIDSIF
jgi:hypothetical protein